MSHDCFELRERSTRNGLSHHMESVKRTPLFRFHEANGARMVPFAGWEMPVQYTGIIEEHLAVRTAAGLFDVSHMGELEITGPGALSLIDRILTNDASRLTPGRALYGLLCFHDGGVVDDVIVYCRAPERYLVVLNAANTEKDIEWISGHAVGYDCTVQDVSASFALVALQGPLAETILQPLTPTPLHELKRFRLIESQIDKVPVIISRTGYTGEDGFELFLPPGTAAHLVALIHEAGQSHGLRLAGLGARDSLRLEAGYPLYGHEISGSIDPLTANLATFVKLGKHPPFVGQSALKEKAAAGLAESVVFFVLDDRRIAREGALIKQEGRTVGRVLSGTHSPSLGKPIGSALVQRNALEAPLSVEVRKNAIPLRITRPPLHKNGIERQSA